MKQRSLEKLLGLVCALALSACTTSTQQEPAWSSEVTRASPLATAMTEALRADQVMNVWLLDVGQGACVVVDCPDGDRPLLIDCGSTARSARNDRDETVAWVSEQLLQWGAPTVVVSHGDEDHYSLIPFAVPPNATDGVWLGGARSDYGSDFEQWAQGVEASGRAVSELPPQFFGPADPDLHCGGAAADILIANATNGASKNGDSIVVALTYGDVTLVFPGDAIGETEGQALANREAIGRLADMRSIVIGSHHGAMSHDSNSLAWAQVWSPYALIFSQKPSSYGHPFCEVVDRYLAHMRSSVAQHVVRCGARAGERRPRACS